MAAALVTIICIAMIVVGGMTLSQGILTSTDASATSVEAISVREGDMMRTGVDVFRAAQLSWGDYLRVTVKNSGQTKLASFDKWDFIVSYVAADANAHSTWLPYTALAPGNNEWQKARIGLNGPVEYFEPGILNPEEEMVILAKLDPLPGDDTNGEISITAPNGVYDSLTFVNPGYLRLTPQSEDITLAGIKYYELVEAAPADGDAMTMTALFSDGEAGRKLLYNSLEPARTAKFIYPLTGISTIPEQDWTVNYRCRAAGASFPFDDNDARFSVTIIIRQADGTPRCSFENVAAAFFAQADSGNWVSITGTYHFSEYSILDPDDYLEIDFYAEALHGPAGGAGEMQISIDNDSLPVLEQTRIEAL